MLLDTIAEYVLSSLIDKHREKLPEQIVKLIAQDTSFLSLLQKKILPNSLDALRQEYPELRQDDQLTEQIIAPAIAHIIYRSVFSGTLTDTSKMQSELDALLTHDISRTQQHRLQNILEAYTAHFRRELAQHQDAGDALIMQTLASLREEMLGWFNALAEAAGTDMRGDITPKARVFISYARSDDEQFVERLYNDLKENFIVWWDRVSMPNRGLTFLQEIRDAIDHSDRLLLVAGAGAFESAYVRDEWQYAYENYKGINIVLRLGDYTDLPDQLRGFDAPDFRADADFEERISILKRQLAEPVAPVGVFHNVPALPPHFLPRIDVLGSLRQLVIADVDQPTLVSAEKRITAIEGMGGLGKSVLAAAFAHDRKVRFAFPDGIVWLTVGNTPSLYELYRSVGVALDDELSNYPDEVTARQKAQKALRDKQCLIILDDVWDLSVARAFRDLISGTTARLLITTRNLQINDLLNANEYRLKLIDESQAADYLRSWVGDDPDLETIAAKLGYLFLALKLAGARMKKDGLSGEDYLLTFDRVSRMRINSQTSERNDSLESSIAMSVDAAFATAEDKKLLYHTFGIFPEDTYVPERTILQLWQYLRPDIDEFDLREILNALVDLALVERINETHSVTLHDLLHDYTREKLGSRYLQTHCDLLDSYRPDSNADWHSVLDDLYMYDHLVFHLIASERTSELIDLFTKSPDWMNIRYIQSATELSFVADWGTAIDYIIQQDDMQIKHIVSMYAARHAIIHRIERVHDEVIEALCYAGEIDTALGFARLRVSPYVRFWSLSVVYVVLRARGTSRPDILDLMESLAIETGSAKTLSAVAALQIQEGRVSKGSEILARIEFRGVRIGSSDSILNFYMCTGEYKPSLDNFATDYHTIKNIPSQSTRLALYFSILRKAQLSNNNVIIDQLIPAITQISDNSAKAIGYILNGRLSSGLDALANIARQNAPYASIIAARIYIMRRQALGEEHEEFYQGLPQRLLEVVQSKLLENILHTSAGEIRDLNMMLSGIQYVDEFALLAIYLAEENYQDEAAGMLPGLTTIDTGTPRSWDWYRANAYNSLVVTLKQFDYVDIAAQIENQLPDDWKDFTLVDLPKGYVPAMQLVENNDYVKALQTLGVCPPDLFVMFVADILRKQKETESAIVLDALVNCTRIMGWEVEYWKDVHDTLVRM